MSKGALSEDLSTHPIDSVVRHYNDLMRQYEALLQIAEMYMKQRDELLRERGNNECG